MEQLDIQGKVEEALRRVLKPYMESDLSALQLIWRFFLGKPQPRRLSIQVGRCARGLVGEDGSPITWTCPVQLEIVSNAKDDGKAHDDLVAMVAVRTYGGKEFKDQLNSAMEKEEFNALFWESDISRESSKESGSVLKTVITGQLEMQPWKDSSHD
jgi:hypothetical protein